MDVLFYEKKYVLKVLCLELKLEYADELTTHLQ